MIIKSVATVLAPGGKGAKLSILIFQRVLARPDPLFPGEQDVRRFDEVLSWMARWFQVMPLDQAVSRLAAGTLPARAAAITFDDGYADNATDALPVLKKHGMTATFFVASSFLDGGRMWNDSVIETVRAHRAKAIDLRHVNLGLHSLESDLQRRAAIDGLLGQIKYLEPVQRHEAVLAIEKLADTQLPGDLMMTASQVKLLHTEGMQIGAHTCSHPILARVTDEDALNEMRSGKIALEAIIGGQVTLFAYPNGRPGKDYLPKHAQMARQVGFSAAVTTAPGVSSPDTDLFQLPRFSPWDKTRLRYGVRMLSNLRAKLPQMA
jgi:peptidoglycan/xylan/chitin deacetylase (PgdA/CDA1 family)